MFLLSSTHTQKEQSCPPIRPHIKLVFNREAYGGPENIVECFAVSEETLRQAQKWQEAQKTLPEAAQLARWLHLNGLMAAYLIPSTARRPYRASAFCHRRRLFDFSD
jgi:hypothetical protein